MGWIEWGGLEWSGVVCTEVDWNGVEGNGVSTPVHPMKKEGNHASIARGRERHWGR